jgi:hypothetical protein
MKICFALVALALPLAFAGPAFAAKGGSLTATNNTIAGPGSTTVDAEGTERIFSHPGASDVCVTVVNTGKGPVDVDITGASSATVSVPTRSSKAVCSDDTTAIDLTCGAGASCAAQWRVDDN